MVVALSAAEMPVVTPCAASMDRVKLVLNLAPFLSLMSGKSSCWQRASVKVKHTNPRACVIIKLIASRGDVACRHDQIPFVFTVLIVHQDDHFACFDVFYDFLGAVQCHTIALQCVDLVY